KNEPQSHQPQDSTGYFRAGVDGIGTLTGMLIGIADKWTNAFVYTDATEKQLRKLTLSYSADGTNWEVLEDDAYPFEFSWQPDLSASVFVKLVGEDRDGNQFESDCYQLN